MAAEQLRDFLYTQMRGARGDDGEQPETTSAAAEGDEALTLLREIRDLLREAAARREGGA